MRNIRHHSIIVTVNDKATIEDLRKKINEVYTKNMEAKNGFQLLSPTIPSLINNFFSFFIAPDGSKEGYDASDDADRVRKLVLEMLRNYKPKEDTVIVQFVELFYGDENEPSSILVSG